MTVKTGQAWAGTFVTLDATGALATPTTGPAGVLYVDGTADAATVTITGSNPYKWSVTLPSLTAGQRVDMYITATIATIATAGFVASEQADTALTSEVKTETAAILADTGTDGVKIASAQTVATVTNLTNLPTMPTDWLTAAGVKADAVTKIQSGLALEATLTAIKGAGWTTETLDFLYDAVGQASDNAEAAYDKIVAAMGAGWTNQTLEKIVSDISAISAGSGATAQEVWEYATRVLTAGTNIDLSSLATAADLATLDDKVDTVDGILDDLHDTDIPAIKNDTAAILVDTGTTLDTLIKDIPTNAELTTALGTADDAVLAAVAAAKVVIDDIHDTDLPAVKTETAAIKAKTDNLPADPAQAGEYTAAIAAIPTTPLLAANYTAPDNAGIAAILADTGTDGVVLKAAGLNADAVAKIQSGLATPTNITAAAGVVLSAAGVDAILDEVVVGSYTMRQLLTVMSAALAGKLSGGGTTTLTFRGIDDASNVIVATVDASNNRSAVTINV